MMMIEKLDNEQEEGSDQRKEQAYKKHLKRLINHISIAPDQSDTENEKVEPGRGEKKTATQEDNKPGSNGSIAMFVFLCFWL
ncbi:hypothetical protein WG954_13200 [Lacibacter sp. H375]|uniref:hypothetical protein n=1 Tax=Lacibacter sp. H375 TaxID=3133424 RepID=UPI0030C24981